MSTALAIVGYGKMGSCSNSSHPATASTVRAKFTSTNIQELSRETLNGAHSGYRIHHTRRGSGQSQ